jgi:hemolysin D
MPNLSHNSSSVLAKPLTDDSIAPVNHQQAAAEVKDWYYGTEELLDALPRAWTRSMLYLLISFAFVILPWSMLTKVDETGSARGRIEPKGATQKLDSAVSGSVIAVNVQEGSTVKAGQVLVEMESDVIRTDLQQTQTKLEGLVNRRGQLELLKNQLMLAITIQAQQNQSQELEKIAQVNQARENLDAKQSSYNLQNLEKLALVEQARQSINSSAIDHKLANSRLSRDFAEVRRYRQLWQMGAIPEVKIVELQKTAEESQRLQEQALAAIKQSQLRLQEQQSSYQTVLSQAQTDIRQAKLRLQEQQSSYQSVVQAGRLAVLKSEEQFKDIQTQIIGLQSEIGQTASQITSLKFQLHQRVVRSPIDGTIFELPIKKPGSVVQLGQTIAQIAPKNSALILKAQMPSQQSGFLKLGMPVKIKFDAYPFQEYGVIAGRIIWISPNSKIQPTNQSTLETFELEISLDQAYVQAANNHIPLTPGQTATAEVIIRQRRVIDLILDPFKKLQKGGLTL